MVGLSTIKAYTRLFKRTGPKDGLKIVAQKFRSKVGADRTAPSSVRFRGLAHDLHLRLDLSDWFVFSQVLVNLEYSEPSKIHAAALAAFYDREVAAGRTPLIVDCGANIGVSSAWYANRYPKARVVAVEPEPTNFAMLRLNAENFKNIIPLQCAVSNSSQRVRLVNKSDQHWAWEIEEDDSGAVSAMSMSDIVKMHADATPFIAKVDIEGAERLMFQSETEWVDRFPLIIFEQHDFVLPWSGCAHSIFKALSSSGARDYIVQGENTFAYSHPLLKPNSQEQLSQHGVASGPTA